MLLTRSLLAGQHVLSCIGSTFSERVSAQSLSSSVCIYQLKINLNESHMFTNYKYFIYFKYAFLLYIHYSNSLIVIHLYGKLSIKLCVNLKKRLRRLLLSFIENFFIFIVLKKRNRFHILFLRPFSYKKFLFRWLLVLIIHLIYSIS